MQTNLYLHYSYKKLTSFQMSNNKQHNKENDKTMLNSSYVNEMNEVLCNITNK